MLRVKFGGLPLFLIKEHLGAARGDPSFFLSDHGGVNVGHGPLCVVVTNPHKKRLLASMEVNHLEGSDWQFDRGKQAAVDLALFVLFQFSCESDAFTYSAN